MDVQFIKKLLLNISEIMQENKDELIRLDSVVGDGDLGLTMSDGFTAGYKAVAESDETDIGKLLYFAGKAMSTAVPSTMGTLMASGLMAAGKQLKGKIELTMTDLADLFKSYAQGVADRGKAKPGEKTFLDGILPAVESLENSAATGLSFEDAAKAAKEAAENGYNNTATMLAVHGRAATRGEASRTLLDPGAKVAVLMMTALSSVN